MDQSSRFPRREGWLNRFPGHRDALVEDYSPQAALFQHCRADAMRAYFPHGCCPGPDEGIDVPASSRPIIACAQCSLDAYEIQNPVGERFRADCIEKGGEFEMNVRVHQARHQDRVIETHHTMGGKTLPDIC